MSLHDFQILKKLGEGAYSLVWKVRRISDGQIYALKKVRMTQLNEKEKRNALNEVRLLASINSPNIISYKEAFFDESSRCLCIVMEYAEGGDLYQQIIQHQRKNSCMEESYLLDVFSQITRGLKAMHDLNILHRDIKSANVFIAENGEVKLGDMNVSKVAKEGMLHTQTGTPYYASPEVWKDVPYDTKSDIWSLGCVMYEAAALKTPFRAENMKALFKKVVSGVYPKLSDKFSNDYKELIALMLQLDPKKRPSCGQLLNLPILSERVDFEEFCFEEKSSLLGTIKLPRNISMLSDMLPRSKYPEDDKHNHSQPPPSIHDRSGLPKISMLEKMNHRVNNSYSYTRNSSKRGSPDIMSLRKESPQRYALENNSKFIRKQYGALKLPRVKYPVSKNIHIRNKKENDDMLKKYVPIHERRRLVARRYDKNEVLRSRRY